jgi:hypothetical protein
MQRRPVDLWSGTLHLDAEGVASGEATPRCARVISLDRDVVTLCLELYHRAGEGSGDAFYGLDLGHDQLAK